MKSQVKNNNNWWTNNAIPITITLLTWAVSFGILTTKVDFMIKQQDELRVEFRDWKKQYEQRLGELEIFKGKASLKLDLK
jgi:Mg2+/citrate symporter